MDKKIRSVICVILLLLASAFMVITVSSDNQRIRRDRGVSIIVPIDQPTIQQAIDNASSGDTIVIMEGDYYGNLNVNKSVDLIGNSSSSVSIF